MTDEKDANANGWSRNGDGTMSNTNSDSKLVTLTGDTGQLYVKRLGEDDVYQPNKH